MNSTGMEVINIQQQVTKGKNTIELDMSGLADGIYLMNIKTDNKSSIQKFVKN
jgi:hypothetical protein